VRVREKCVTCKTDTNCFVTQRGCNTAASFGLSDLKQYSEQLHKQSYLDLKPLTSSDIDPAQSTAPSAARLQGKMTSLAARIAGFPKAQPFVFNLGVAAAKTSAADLLTQTVVEKKSFPNGIDWKRNASFTVFGFAYLGGFQYWLQVNMFRKMFVGMDKVAEMPLCARGVPRRCLHTMNRLREWWTWVVSFTMLRAGPRN